MSIPDGEITERLGQLEEAFDALISHVEQLTETVTANTAPTGPDPVSGNESGPPWLHHRPAGDTLADWVDWFNDHGYQPAQPPLRIPDCWDQHPGLVAELSTLWWSWQHAFLRPKAEPEAAQNWHDRWLPGMLHRIGNWVLPRCLNGNHDGEQSWTPTRRAGQLSDAPRTGSGGW